MELYEFWQELIELAALTAVRFRCMQRFKPLSYRGQLET
jgi:hypothetical protein